MSNIAIIFAAGHGIRMKTSTPKQFLLINNKPILAYTLDLFNSCPKIDKILLVTLKEKINYSKKLIKKYKFNKVIDVIEGSTTAFASQFNGLMYLKNHNTKNDIVIFHDGVRPLINNDTIEETIKLAKNKGNAVVVSPAKETISINNDNGEISSIMPRESCYVVRAPQVFRFLDIYESHLKANKDGLTFVDSASLMQHYGYKINTIIGPVENIKVTTENDFVVCKYFLKRKK